MNRIARLGIAALGLVLALSQVVSFASAADIPPPTGADILTFKGGIPGVDPALPMIVSPGQEFTYGILAANAGTEPATNLRVVDLMPPSVTPASPAPPGCTFESSSLGSLLDCSVDTLPAGGIHEIAFVAQATAAGVVANTVLTFSPISGPIPISGAQIIMGVQPVTTSPGEGADLEVMIATRPDGFDAPAAWSHAVTVINHGPGMAKTPRLLISLAAPLGDRVRLVSHSVDSDHVTCSIASALAPLDFLTPPTSVSRANIVCKWGADMPANSTSTLTLDMEAEGDRGGLAIGAGTYHYRPDPFIRNNEQHVTVPNGRSPRGDADGDGLVSHTDLLMFATCLGTNVDTNAACRDADVDGDGSIDQNDLSVIRDNLRPGRISRTVQPPIANAPLGTLGSTFAKAKTAVQTDFADRFFDTDFRRLIIRELGTLMGVQPPDPSKARAGTSAGTHKIYDQVPPGQVVGVSGAAPCIGVILRTPEGMVYTFHFDFKSDPGATLRMYTYPAGTRAAIHGGTPNPEYLNESTTTLRLVQEALDADPNITVDGFHGGDSLFIDDAGTYSDVPRLP